MDGIKVEIVSATTAERFPSFKLAGMEYFVIEAGKEFFVKVSVSHSAPGLDKPGRWYKVEVYVDGISSGVYLGFSPGDSRVFQGFYDCNSSGTVKVFKTSRPRIVEPEFEAHAKDDDQVDTAIGTVIVKCQLMMPNPDPNDGYYSSGVRSTSPIDIQPCEVRETAKLAKTEAVQAVSGRTIATSLTFDDAKAGAWVPRTHVPDPDAEDISITVKYNSTFNLMVRKLLNSKISPRHEAIVDNFIDQKLGTPASKEQSKTGKRSIIYDEDEDDDIHRANKTGKVLECDLTGDEPTWKVCNKVEVITID